MGWISCLRQPAPEVLLRRVLAGLAALSLGATLLRPLRVAAPPPLRPAPSALQLPGFQLQPAAGMPASEGREISFGVARRFRLRATAASSAPPMELELLLLPVRSRHYSQLQLAAIGRLRPELRLMQRQLLLQPDGTELASGTSAGPASQRRHRLQTCLTPADQAGVTNATLIDRLQAERAAWQRRQPLQAAWIQLSGVAPHTRWECLAVNLQTAPGQGTPEQLLSAWLTLQPQLLSPAAQNKTSPRSPDLADP